jgi:K+-sensing histidine kinase KdpD
VAVLKISDQGPGVAPADLNRIFERYFIDRQPVEIAVNGEDGTARYGIGLWIVRRNLEVLVGSAEAQNLPGSGFGFGLILRIPLAGCLAKFRAGCPLIRAPAHSFAYHEDKQGNAERPLPWQGYVF